MPNLHFSGSYFWFVFSLIVLVLCFILLRRELPKYANTDFYPYVIKWWKWVLLVLFILVLFGNFQITSRSSYSTIRGFDNTTPVKTETVNTPKEPIDVRGNFNKAIDKSKKDLDQ